MRHQRALLLPLLPVLGATFFACSSNVDIDGWGGQGGAPSTTTATTGLMTTTPSSSSSSSPSSSSSATVTVQGSQSVTTAVSSSSGLGGEGGGVPDLIVDEYVLESSVQLDTVNSDSDPCLLGEQCLNGTGERLVLRFSTRTSNVGTADFVIGDPSNSPDFVFSPCHGHYHYYDYASYRLVDASNNLVVSGHKQGFAVIDIGMIDPNDPNTNPFPVYGGGNQGIQKGWYDEYGAGLSCQWIDVTGVPPGDYLLEVEVNPSQSFFEGDYANNTATIPVTIPECPFGCDFLDGDCTVGQCVQGTGCVAMPVAEGSACDDDLFCTEQTTCTAGVCGGGAPKECAPPGGCFIGSCDEASDSCLLTPGNDGSVCDDGSPCTSGTTCVAGACIGGAPANDGMACNDGVSCTSGETCSGGVCGGGMGPQIYFADDFSDNAAGWTLGATWEIGPALPTTNADINGDDPASDHTPTPDNGVGGVVLGGLAPAQLHDFYWMESPAFDSSVAPGPVKLSFWRWLNSDFSPWMVNRIEVFDGAQWQLVWTSGTSSIVDNPGGGGSGWTYVEHDVTAFKNAGMRVRFGYNVGNVNGLYDIGSWNVDDVLVAATGCP